MPPAATRYLGLTFSRDGNFLYSVQSEARHPSSGTLYKIPALGGNAKRLVADVESAVTLPPDGRQLAFVRRSKAKNESALVIVNDDGSAERQVAVRKWPNDFASPSWSPDEKSIALAANNSEADFSYGVPVEIQIKGGKERSVNHQRWQAGFDLTWMPDGRGFLVTTQEHPGGISQIEYVSSATGTRARSLMISTTTSD
jgi:Tol biopolymer transport system component